MPHDPRATQFKPAYLRDTWCQANCQLLHHPLSVHLLSPLQAQHTAAVVNELSSELHKLLQHHPINQQRRAEGKAPANCVLLRGCGSRISVPSFEQLHGMKACLVAPTKIIAGD